MSRHLCHARGCEQPVPPELLLCLAHWRRVPRSVQRAVKRLYRAGQCADRRPSREWIAAARAALRAIAESAV